MQSVDSLYFFQKYSYTPQESPWQTVFISEETPFLATQGKYEEADSLYRGVIESGEKMLGADHPDLATILDSRAGLLQNQVKVESAACVQFGRGALFLRSVRQANIFRLWRSSCVKAADLLNHTPRGVLASNVVGRPTHTFPSTNPPLVTKERQ